MDQHPDRNDTFHYRYSVREQAEIKRIREKYAPQEAKAADKMARLRALDASVTSKANMASLILGILSSLVLGVGMCCCLVWGAALTVFTLGIVIGLVGIVGIALAYPLYVRVLRRERARVAPEILRLTDELMK